MVRPISRTLDDRKLLKMAYDKVKTNEWVYPVKRGYKMMCCDCGLVHIIDFDHIKYGRGRKIRLKARRDNRATANARRGKKCAVQVQVQ